MWPSWPASAAVLWTLPVALGSSQPLCPASCTADPSNWTPYHSLEIFKDCHRSVLLDFSSHGSTEAAFSIRACTVDDRPDAESTDPQSIVVNPGETQTEISSSAGDHDDSASIRQLNLLLHHVQTALIKTPNRDIRSMIGRLRTTAVGIYNGLAINDTLTASVIDTLRSKTDGWGRRTTAIQLCGRDRDVDHTFGIALDTAGDTAAVQQAVESWARGRCVESGNGALDARDLTAIEELPVVANNTVEEKVNNVTVPAAEQPLRNVSFPMTREKVHHSPVPAVQGPQHNVSHSYTTNGIEQQFTCVTETVRKGDTCGDLARRCGVTGDEFMTLNSQEGLCTWLRPGEEVCCSPRTLKEGKPEMNQDGSCAAYLTKDEDTCASIASAHGLPEAKISYFNDGRSWGWSGCNLIHGGLRICLSEGYPPLPPPRTGAACGPTVPGTEMPTDGTPLAALNPCPLNACCNTKGNCGVSPEFCIFEEGPTGNPGSAPKDRMGCISNCGMDILDNSEAPAEFMRIGYYESFNLDRPCLNLRAAHIKVHDYTHIHWGFATIDTTFRIGVNDTHNQWADFLALQGVKRILSFGGWGYTVNGEVYDVLREAMKPENVDTFIVNIMEFVQDNGLDGVDFDWEYPGASEFPSVAASLHSDGPNYLAFLTKLRKIFPREKTVSMAAPASYWHLKVFPIAEMWHHLDYVIYMTYDFHGQWDYEGFYVQDWCEGGNCLRSHVTKAGVPRSAIAVGVASYGRAFGMTDADCTEPECKFKGPETAAIPGMCTRTPGVLAIAEIEALMIEGDINESYYDPASDSNVLVYNDTQWVAFMSKNTMRRRVEYYRSLKFGGFANWAVDLTHWSGDDIEPEKQVLDFFVLGNAGPAT
ncbi:glycoside hydrolase superfamily [Aspergillus undulatus]|uniref:glycoside hydrolase superfamily n=1 Tax=Aspergillus undulatus TaxID=1810928 RepID=UPI003CCCA6C2